MQNITIIGAGWLGKPLAKFLSTIGHQVTVSRTTAKGCQALQEEGMQAFIADLNHDIEPLTEELIRQQSEIVIGCFPPGFRRGHGDSYVQQWQHLVSACQAAKVHKIVMISSTTVYPSIAEDMTEDKANLTLAMHNELFSDNARIMLTAEQTVIDSGLKFAIVRPSGLIGPDRNPARFAARLKTVSTTAPANMIHQLDAVGIVSFCALKEGNQTVNATTPFTVSKAEFYQQAIDLSGNDIALPPIVDQADKRIVADRIESLGYRFHFTHALEALNHIAEHEHG